MQLVNKADEAAADILRAFESPESLPSHSPRSSSTGGTGRRVEDGRGGNQLIVAIRGHHEARGFRSALGEGGQEGPSSVRRRSASSHLRRGRSLKVRPARSGRSLSDSRAARSSASTRPRASHSPLRRGPTEEWLASLPLRDVAGAWGLPWKPSTAMEPDASVSTARFGHRPRGEEPLDVVPRTRPRRRRPQRQTQRDGRQGEQGASPSLAGRSC